MRAPLREHLPRKRRQPTIKHPQNTVRRLEQRESDPGQKGGEVCCNLLFYEISQFRRELHARGPAAHDHPAEQAIYVFFWCARCSEGRGQFELLQHLALDRGAVFYFLCVFFGVVMGDGGGGGRVRV